MSQDCPRCRLLSPNEALRCDCGYDFTTRSVESSYLAAGIVKSQGHQRLSGNFTAAFFLHLIAATVATFAALSAGLVLGLAGQLALFAPVVVAAIVTGWFTTRRLNPSAAAWVWVPTAIWFAGWALFDLLTLGLDHFMTAFVGVGFCGDFACAGQFFVTGPLVGSISYAVVGRSLDRIAR